MIIKDFSNTHLTYKEIWKLRISKLFPVKGNESYDRLFRSDLVYDIKIVEDEFGNCISKSNKYKITETGKHYLKYRFDKNFTGKLPVITSIVALVVSMISLLLKISFNTWCY